MSYSIESDLKYKYQWNSTSFPNSYLPSISGPPIPSTISMPTVPAVPTVPTPTISTTISSPKIPFIPPGLFTFKSHKHFHSHLIQIKTTSTNLSLLSNILYICQSIGQTVESGTFIHNTTVNALYYDLRDSIIAFNYLNDKFTNELDLQIKSIPPFQFNSIITKLLDFDIELFKNSQLFIKIDNTNYSTDVIYNNLSKFGDIKLFKVTNGLNNSLIFICEYYDIRSSINCLNESNSGDCPFKCNFINDISLSTNSSSSTSFSSLDTSPNNSYSSNSSDEIHGNPGNRLAFNNAATTTDAINTTTTTATTNNNTIKNSTAITITDPNIPTTPTPTTTTTTTTIHSTKPTNIQPNSVDLNRIAQGLDTRKTIMIRNIPNKLDQQMLKEYIDVTNRNTYDFLYLRIDFTNKCNVGYAFISFINPKDIITFANNRVGTKWNKFNSDKCCDISYANIYVDKPIRNSS